MKEYSFEEYLGEKMDDQSFKIEWDELEGPFMVAQVLIKARAYDVINIKKKRAPRLAVNK